MELDVDDPLLDKSQRLRKKYGLDDENFNPYTVEQPTLTTAPKQSVNRTIPINPAIQRLGPQVLAKGWTRLSDTQYQHKKGTLTIGHESGKITGQYADSSSRSYELSYITYEVDSKTVRQDYMSSDPEKMGIGTVLCYEGLCAARKMGCDEVFVSMANDNSAQLLRKMLGEDSGASSSCCGCCFLVTACAEARGLPADCAELTTLRAFRDGYLRQRAGGEEMIGLYYQVAPPIVAALWATPEPAREFEALYGAIRQCVELIESADLEGALRFYRDMVESLARRFLSWE